MRVITGLMLLVLVVVSVWAQKPEDATRKLWDTAFIASSSNKKTTTRRRAR